MRAFVVLAAACGGGLHVTPLPTPEPFAIVGGDVLAAHGKAVQRVGPDGTVRWTSAVRGSWLLAPGQPHAYVVTEQDEHYHQTIVEVELATGRAVHVSAPFEIVDHWARGGATLYRVSSAEVARVDPETGATRWTMRGVFNEYRAMPAADALWISCGDDVCGFAAADGHALGSLPGGRWPKLTPDGGTLATGDGATLATFDTRTREPGWTADSPDTAIVGKIAVTDRWIAEQVDLPRADPDVPDTTLRVHRRDTGDVVWSTHRTGERSYLEYIAVGGDLFVYYDSRDAALHAVHLPDGATAIVYRLHEKFVLSTDAQGVAPAVPDAAPIVDGDLILVQDFGDRHAVRVTDR